jgi:hypothetical protein
MQGEALTWNFLASHINGNGEPIRCIGDGFRTACSDDDGGKRKLKEMGQAKEKRE